MNHTARRTTRCMPTERGSRGLNQFRYQTSTKCPPNVGHSARTNTIGHWMECASRDVVAETTIVATVAISTLRTIVVRSGSRNDGIVVLIEIVLAGKNA